MKRTARISLTLVLAVLVIAPVLRAQAGRGRERQSRDTQAGQASAQVTVSVFTDDEKRKIRDWYGEAKIQAKPLPPGIARNLARGKPLPPGIAKQTIPPDLERVLPARPDFERLVVGTDIVLVKSGIVVDILVGVLF